MALINVQLEHSYNDKLYLFTNGGGDPKNRVQLLIPKADIDLDDLPTVVADPSNDGTMYQLGPACTHEEIEVSEFEEHADEVDPLQVAENPDSWGDPQTKLLLSEYSSKITLVQSGAFKTKKKMWEDIAETLKASGYKFTPKQVEDRFGTLKRSYKKYVKSTKKRGSACVYQKEMEEIIEKDPDILPVVTISQEKVVISGDKNSSGEEETCDILNSIISMSTPSISSDEEGADPPRKCKKKTVGTVAEELRRAIDRICKRAEEAERRRQQRHSEKMKLLRELINAINSKD